MKNPVFRIILFFTGLNLFLIIIGIFFYSEKELSQDLEQKFLNGKFEFSRLFTQSKILKNDFLKVKITPNNSLDSLLNVNCGEFVFLSRSLEILQFDTFSTQFNNMRKKAWNQHLENLSKIKILSCDSKISELENFNPNLYLSFGNQSAGFAKEKSQGINVYKARLSALVLLFIVSNLFFILIGYLNSSKKE